MELKLHRRLDGFMGAGGSVKGLKGVLPIECEH